MRGEAITVSMPPEDWPPTAAWVLGQKVSFGPALTYGRVMEKSMQWMTLQELRDELDRTRPAWDELADLDDVLEDGELPALRKDACRHDLILNELLRRPNNG